MSHTPLLAGAGGHTGQERSTGEVTLEFSSGEQRLLISEVFETFPCFHTSGIGYLQALLTQGARAVHCNTSRTELPPAGELVCGKALGSEREGL